MTHIMVDLETMGNRPDAAIVSIGAVRFELPTVDDLGYHPGRIGDSFYENVDLQSSIQSGLTVSGDTVYWWLQQEQAARDALRVNPQPLGITLNLFSDFWKGFTHDRTDGSYAKRANEAEMLWAHGASFDVAILKSAYANTRMQQPFKYNADSDDRTLFRITGTPPWDELAKHVTGVAHNALYDAEVQARAVIWAYNQVLKTHYDLALLKRKAEHAEEPDDEIMRAVGEALERNTFI